MLLTGDDVVKMYYAGTKFETMARRAKDNNGFESVAAAREWVNGVIYAELTGGTPPTI